MAYVTVATSLQSLKETIDMDLSENFGFACSFVQE